MNDIMRLVPRVTNKLDDEAIKSLDEMVADAKNGEYIAVAFVAVRVDHSVDSVITTKSEAHFSLVGALESAKHMALEGDDE